VDGFAAQGRIATLQKTQQTLTPHARIPFRASPRTAIDRPAGIGNQCLFDAGFRNRVARGGING